MLPRNLFQTPVYLPMFHCDVKGIREEGNRTSLLVSVFCAPPTTHAVGQCGPYLRPAKENWPLQITLLGHSAGEGSRVAIGR